MSQKIYLIANWKMQLLDNEAVDLTTKIIPEYKNINNKNLELILCPTFTALSKVGEIIKKTDLKLGAQNVWYHEKGSYTGEVSPCQLKELGVEYIIIGHSERRQNLNETNEEINRKINICLDNQITPILCVGETFDERRLGKTDLILMTQVSQALEDIELKKNQKIIIAYEPVWVIGSGQAIEPKDAEHSAQVIKQTLLDFFDKEVIEKNIFITYGGSVEENNVKEFIQPGLLEGVLVGGASLSIEKFLPLVHRLSS